GEPPARVAYAGTIEPGRPLAAAQSFVVTATFHDGSVATILYSADGASALPKEYVEAHSGGRSAVLDDFRRLTLAGGGGRRMLGRRGQDKGHRAQLVAFRALVAGARDDGVDPLDSTAATLAAVRSAETGDCVEL